jgi:hypothetical protein
MASSYLSPSRRLKQQAVYLLDHVIEVVANENLDGFPSLYGAPPASEMQADRRELEDMARCAWRYAMEVCRYGSAPRALECLCDLHTALTLLSLSKDV